MTVLHARDVVADLPALLSAVSLACHQPPVAAAGLSSAYCSDSVVRVLDVQAACCCQ